MKKPLLILGLMLLPTLAMAAPDFSGSWVLNKSNSDPAPNDMYWMTREAPGGGGGGRGNAQVVINVHQDAKTLQVADSQHPNRAYMLDGTEHTVPTDTGVEKAHITAGIQGDDLIIDTSEPYGGMPGNATLKVKETWSISPDGKTLTVTTTRAVAAKTVTFKQVYNKTEASNALCSAGCVPAPQR